MKNMKKRIEVVLKVFSSIIHPERTASETHVLRLVLADFSADFSKMLDIDSGDAGQLQRHQVPDFGQTGVPLTSPSTHCRRSKLD